MQKTFNGWLNIYKEQGETSFSISKELKKKFKFKKVGHLGTLDPLAKGVLPIAVGEATKSIKFISNLKKRYSFLIKWGEETDTCDLEGKVVAQSSVRPDLEKVKMIIKKFFTGSIEQVPPIYSAVKVNGVRAYKLARSKKDIELKKKKIHIYKILVKNQTDKDFCKFDIICSRGTYIRSLARDLARKLGTVGFAYEIVRTEDNIFKIENSVPLLKVLNLSYEELQKIYFPIESVLSDAKEVILEKKYSDKLKNGIIIKTNLISNKIKSDSKLILVKNNSKLVCIANLEKEYIIPRRNFNL
jgi:tRNA pseudouridine55 synthase